MPRSYQSALNDESRMSDNHMIVSQANSNVMSFFKVAYEQMAKDGQDTNNALMEGMRKYYNTLNKLNSNIGSLKEEEYNRYMQELGEMQGWLSADAGNGKTNYQMISAEVDRYMQQPRVETTRLNLLYRRRDLVPGWEPGKGAEALDKSLNIVGKYYDVGLDIIAVQKAQAQSEAGHESLDDKANSEFKSYEEYVQYQWDQANREGISDEKRQGHLARIIAANGLYLQLPEKDRRKSPETGVLEEIAHGVAGTEAFKNLMSNGNDKVFAFNRDADILTRNLTSAMGMAAPYQVSETKKARIREQAGFIADKLRVSWEAAIFGNSDEYEKAVNAIESTVSSSMTGEDLYKSVKTVEDYCDLRYKPRKSPDGQMRFRQCMNFLKVAKPPKEFQAYCDHINLLRGVKPGDKDYIAPELYGIDNRTAEYVMRESLENLHSGEGSVRDVARIIAADRLGRQGGRNAILDPQKLMQETEAILANPEFKEMAASESLEELTEMVDASFESYQADMALHTGEKVNEKNADDPEFSFDSSEVKQDKQEIDEFNDSELEFKPPEAGFSQGL